MFQNLTQLSWDIEARISPVDETSIFSIGKLFS